MSRVEGILACSRALGDFILKPYVSAVPDVVQVAFDRSFTSSTAATLQMPGNCSASFLILASDGVWDVFTSQEAVEFVWNAIHEHKEIGGENWTLCFNAAYSLVAEALNRGSTDNVSAVVLCHLEVLFSRQCSLSTCNFAA